MASYCPVIAPIVGGPIEVVVDGESGYLIDSKDHELLSTICKLAGDYTLWAEMAENAKKRSFQYSETEYEIKVISIFVS